MNTDQQPTWSSVKKDLKRRDRAPWVEGLVTIVLCFAVAGAAAVAIDFAIDKRDRDRAAYERLVEGEVEDRLNREGDDHIDLDVRVVYSKGPKGGSGQHTFVTINGTEREDCWLWRTEKDDPDTWEIRCGDER
jgi:hypothetical protein